MTTKVTITGLGRLKKALDNAEANFPKEIFSGFARHMGKGHQRDKLIEEALDRGQTIVVVSHDGVEVRGPGAARDVTPCEPLRLAKPTEDRGGSGGGG